MISSGSVLFSRPRCPHKVQLARSGSCRLVWILYFIDRSQDIASARVSRSVCVCVSTPVQKGRLCLCVCVYARLCRFLLTLDSHFAVCILIAVVCLTLEPKFALCFFFLYKRLILRSVCAGLSRSQFAPRVCDTRWGAALRLHTTWRHLS